MIEKSNVLQKIDEIRLTDIIASKFGVEVVAESISTQVGNGAVDPLELAVRMKALEELAKAIREKVETRVINELSKLPQKKAEVLGAKISVVDSVKYDYSNVPGWRELDDTIVGLTDKRKSIEEYQKKWHRGDLPMKSNCVAYKVELPKKSELAK